MNIVIDIGGTNTRVAKTTDNENFGEPIIFNTPQGFDLWLAVLKEHIATLTGGQKIDHLIAGVPGTFNEDKSTILKTPHLEKWQGLNLKKIFEETFMCVAHLENDTALVGLGEAVFGSGKGNDIVVYITISTGVGGVRIVNGKVDANKQGFEIGHQIISEEKGKELEYFISGSSLEKRFNMPSRDNKDPELWNEVDYDTGILAANTIMYWSPAIMVFGGPVMNDIHLEEVEKYAKAMTPMYDKHPLFVRSSLKSLGGLYGGLAYFKNLTSE